MMAEIIANVLLGSTAAGLFILFAPAHPAWVPLAIAMVVIGSRSGR